MIVFQLSWFVTPFVCFSFKNVTLRSKVLSQQRFHFSLNITFSYMRSINVQKLSIYFVAKSNHNSLHNNFGVQLFLQKKQKINLNKVFTFKNIHSERIIYCTNCWLLRCWTWNYWTEKVSFCCISIWLPFVLTFEIRENFGHTLIIQYKSLAIIVLLQN